MAKVYALLVGINDYSPQVGKLRGCLNDVDHFHNYLRTNCNKGDLAIEILRDSDATRANIITLFRSLLCNAKADDVALFQYCGHGARWASAKAFHKYYPDGKDEGLVCYDSRQDGSFDLADKELAVLLAEVAAHGPHIAVIFDCCHSGSATRGVDDFMHLKARQTHEVFEERPLDSYLDGHYAQLDKKGESLFIPSSQHILLAACERGQKAWETQGHSGVFTSTLLEVLDKSGSDITYADLFVRCRSAVRQHADNQNPQFETYKSFNAYSGFLGRQAAHRVPRYNVYFEHDVWMIDCGAVHGLPTEPEKSVGLALYPEDGQAHLAGQAATTLVGAQKSELKLHFTGDTTVRYRAEITSLPVAPMPVYLDGDEEGKKRLRKALDPAIGADLTDIEAGTRYTICAENGQFLLKQRERDLMIQGVEGYSEASALHMLSVLKQVLQWERNLALQNHGTRMDTALIDLCFMESLDNGQEHVYPGTEITLDYVYVKDKSIRGTLKACNRTEQTLHFALFYFSGEYGIQVLKNDPIAPTGDDYITLWEDGFYLEEGVNESSENFKLIVSTEQVDDFLLDQKDLKLGRIVPSTRAISSVKQRQKLTYENEWFTKTLQIRVVRQSDHVSDKDASLANRQITVKAHPSVTANLSLTSAKTGSRSTGAGAGIYQVLERLSAAAAGQPRPFEMLNLSGTRGQEQSVLELTDIQNAETLKDHALEIELDIPLDNDEYILPVTFDGQHLLLGGDPSKDENGRTHIRIDHIPDIPDNRRSLGKALKLYFFKTYLKRDNINQLCCVEYQPDGTVKRQEDVREKVASASNILLLIHGIIGDTEGIAKGLRLAMDATGRSVDQQFDLVLSYDYENLGTSITDTAVALKQQLEAAGLHAHDGKRLTLLAHSMGGLVSRCFIEQLGGYQLVDHLVMCGTPNNGSPYGKVDTARTLMQTLTTLALNYVPVMAPFSGAILFLLNRSRRLTPTLEQMNATSAFLRQLNRGTGDDPHVPYTLLAGNIADFEEEADHGFAQLLTKAGKGIALDALFGHAAHDIAVSVASILAVDSSRAPTPRKAYVACHHLNYFASVAGLRALAAVDW